MTKRIYKIMNLDDLSYDDSQAKRDMNEDYLESLGQSILDRGLINPIHIMPDGLIITGERRVRAAKRVGIKELKCDVRYDIAENFEGEKLKSELRSERVGENWHRSRGEKLSLYLATEFKRQQEYYRSLTNDELWCELESYHYINNDSLPCGDLDSHKKRIITKNKPDFYHLIAHKLRIVNRDGSPQANYVRDNILLIDRVSKRASKLLEDVSDNKILWQLAETFKINTPNKEQQKALYDLQERIVMEEFDSKMRVRVLVQAIDKNVSEKVLEKVEKKSKAVNTGGELTKSKNEQIINEAVKEHSKDIESSKEGETLNKILMDDFKYIGELSYTLEYKIREFTSDIDGVLKDIEGDLVNIELDRTRENRKVMECILGVSNQLVILKNLLSKGKVNSKLIAYDNVVNIK